MKRSEYYKSIDSSIHSANNLKVANAFIETVRRGISLPATHGFEVGCGYGLAAELMTRHVDNLTVSDINPQALDFIKWKFQNTIHVLRDNTIPSDADFIYFFMSLHHIPTYMDMVRTCVEHIKKVRGKGIAICELQPDNLHPFHLHEPNPFDGLNPDAFEFVNAIPRLTLNYTELPPLKHHDIDYSCYTLIIKPL